MMQADIATLHAALSPFCVSYRYLKMASRSVVKRGLNILQGRWQSTAAVTPLSDPLPDLPPLEPCNRPQAEGVKVTKLANGMSVASLETFSPVSMTGVFVRAGSRYEPAGKQGVTHLWRTCAYQSSEDRSAFRISREIEQLGGSLTSTTTREHLIYCVSHMRNNLNTALATLGAVVGNKDFRRWEVEDQKDRMYMDIALSQTQPNSVVMEELHKSAFRKGLCNSIYSPTFNIPKWNYIDLNSFVKDFFVGNRMTLVGIGVNHDELVKEATASFHTIPSGLDFTTEPAEYVGGGEVRIASDSSVTHAAIACQGASLKNDTKSLLTAGVLQHVLGGSPLVKWSTNNNGRLGKAVSATVQGPAAVNAFNIGYSDNGLFGIYAISGNSDVDTLLRSIVKEFKNVAVGSVEQDLAKAKNQLKTHIMMGAESQDAVFSDIGLQVSLKGTFTDSKEACKLIDDVSPQDVISLARKILNTKANLCVLGDIAAAPRLDTLLAELK